DTLKDPEQIDLIILTHGHADHASDAPAFAKKLGSKIAATYELCNIMLSEGVAQDQVLYMNKGGTIEWEGLKITLTDAKHSSSYDKADGPVYAGEACGVVIRDTANSIYHAGDTCLFSDMNLIRERYSPTLALLPIGDVFTMGPEDAALAAHFLGVKKAIPIHYGTFDALTGTAEDFSSACSSRGIEAIILEPGATFPLVG
ncbi:MAG: metal-dependent hydrolase, partial [Bdellovibrionales bacterium]|nr:metal-dependent hydrolase [Bdellovibrionales bacterium]